MRDLEVRGRDAREDSKGIQKCRWPPGSELCCGFSVCGFRRVGDMFLLTWAMTIGELGARLKIAYFVSQKIENVMCPAESTLNPN